jgi:hypothetical protein
MMMPVGDNTDVEIFTYNLQGHVDYVSNTTYAW